MKFFGAFALWLLVAIDALGQLGYAREAPVFAEKMTAFTAVFHLGDVQGVVEIDGLFLFRIKQRGKEYPADGQADGEADDEK